MIAGCAPRRPRASCFQSRFCDRAPTGVADGSPIVIPFAAASAAAVLSSAAASAALDLGIDVTWNIIPTPPPVSSSSASIDSPTPAAARAQSPDSPLMRAAGLPPSLSSSRRISTGCEPAAGSGVSLSPAATRSLASFSCFAAAIAAATILAAAGGRFGGTGAGAAVGATAGAATCAVACAAIGAAVGAPFTPGTWLPPCSAVREPCSSVGADTDGITLLVRSKPADDAGRWMLLRLLRCDDGGLLAERRGKSGGPWRVGLIGSVAPAPCTCAISSRPTLAALAGRSMSFVGISTGSRRLAGTLRVGAVPGLVSDCTWCLGGSVRSSPSAAVFFADLGRHRVNSATKSSDCVACCGSLGLR